MSTVKDSKSIIEYSTATQSPYSIPQHAPNKLPIIHVLEDSDTTERGLRKPPASISCLQLSKARGRSWKPCTLRWLILGPLIIISLLIIVLLEVLFHRSSRRGSGGGLAFAADVNSLSKVSTFVFLYLPTVIAVCYSTIWTWIDLDTKRLEPWFQLSNSEGATAENSILLQYPFDFLPFIPIKAFKKNHWAVFLSGTVMLLVFWIVTPLQSAIFNTATVNRTLTTPMVDVGSLAALSVQSNILNSNFLNKAYGISWLGEDLPGFTTSDYALLPFEPESDSSFPVDSQTWSTSANIFRTSLNCNPANVTLTSQGYTFDNGEGCSVSDLVLASTSGQSVQYMVNYIGYFDNPQLDWALQNPNCSIEHANNFLALFATNATELELPGTYGNLTALFCQPSYSIETANVSVNASDGSILQPTVDLDATDLLVKDYFNVTQFEYLLGVGVQPTNVRSDYPDTIVLEQYPQLQTYDVAWPVSNMVGFAIAPSPTLVEEFISPDRLQAAFQGAHRLLFSAAFSTLTVQANSTPPVTARPGAIESSLGAIIMVRSISLIVECALGVIALMAGSLWYFTACRNSNMVKDPASMADTMETIQSQHLLPQGIVDHTAITTSIDIKDLPTAKFRLALVGPKEAQHPKLFSSNIEYSSDKTSTRESYDFIPGTEKSAEPKELSLYFGTAFIGSIFMAIWAIIFLDIWTSKKNGISLPSSNSIVLSILENYLPTAFATLLEPTWVILARLLCLLVPFEELRRGNAEPGTTLEAKYSSLPPQLNAAKAIRSCHFLLGAVSIIAVSTNILSVSLSGLIIEKSANIVTPLTGTQDLAPQFNGAPVYSQIINVNYYDHLYASLANLREDTPLPNWVDNDNFYIPFESYAPAEATSSGVDINLQNIQASTVGFGADLTCYELSQDLASNNTYTFEPFQNGSIAGVYFFTTHLLPNGSRISCQAENVENDGHGTLIYTNYPSTGRSAIELMTTMGPSANASVGPTSDICSQFYISGWARGVETSDGTIESNSTFIACTSNLLVADYNISVDINGAILSSVQTTNFSADLSPYFTNSSGADLLDSIKNIMVPFSPTAFNWHNDSFTSDWINSLLGYQNHTNALVNPAFPPPDADTAIAEFKILYRQLFALLIGFNSDHIFSRPEVATPIALTALITETRIFLSPLMFKITLILLLLHLIVAILYYVYRPKRFLPQLPTSIASILRYFVASQAAEDYCVERKGKNWMRYGYGRYTGMDRKTRVGIEQQRFVVPLEIQSPEIKKRKWTLRQDSDRREPKSWI